VDERLYQATLEREVYDAWAAGAQNVLMRLDTGGGKTFILSRIANAHPGASAIIAHRQELVLSLSMAIASHGLRHNLIASSAVRRAIAAQHIAEFGRSYFDPGARCAVASVDTLVKRDDLEAWAAQVTLWITDEGHHLVLDNKWHTAVQMFTNPAVRGLLPTATPKRADGKGLGRAPVGQGVADVMVEGPPMRWLIEQGFLSDYTIVCPPSDLEMLGDVGASGDWSPKQGREASQRSHIVGDVVAHYLKYGRGKLGITFSTDVETAAEMTQAYRAAGVRAETLTGKTEGGYRRQILKQYAARQIDQIVAVDIVSEGFDLPAIEVASMARPTQSLALYMQQFGRALRPLAGKDKAIIIDHVGNFVRHGPPDRPRVWTLASRGRAGGGGDGIPLRVCTQCFFPYERIFHACPKCGHHEEPGSRSSPQAVDGDLVELDAETLARLRGAVLEADQSIEDKHRWLATQNVPNIAYKMAARHHIDRQDAQAALRASMEGFVRRSLALGLKDREIHRKFYLVFGVDVLSARALSATDANALREKVESYGN
jgi:superfamily II DNA or RNA helicase